MLIVRHRLSAFVAVLTILVQSLSAIPTGIPVSEKRINAPSAVFSNTTPIAINTAIGLTAPTTASTYPSTINVSGMTGTTTKVEVTIRGITHTMNQVDMLLVSPTGAKFVFLSDSTSPGGNDNFYTFSDSGTAVLTSPVSASGTYLPTDVNSGTDSFPAPAPAGPYSVPPTATFASVFNGADPNGTWSLYAVDDTLNSTGYVVSGWSLNITTTAAPQTFSNPNYFSFSDIYAVSAPYGTSINVSGQTGVLSNIKVKVTGYFHASSGDVDMLLVSPNGRALTLMSDVASAAVSNIDLTFDDAATSGINVNPIVTGTYRPTDNSNDIDFFSSPAPLRPYLESGQNQLNNFYGFSPNGEWRLFVVDDTQNNSGSISGGWSLDITTVPTPPPPPLSCSGPSFAPSSFPVGNNPTNLAVADLNNDSKADVAVTNQASNDVSVLLGNGNGGLGTQAVFPVGTAPYSIVAGHFNADINLDLAVANSGSNSVSILIGNGSGGFSAPSNFAAGINPISIASADFNSDGKADLAVTNFGGFFFGTVSILFGNGTGGFTTGTPLRTRTQPSFVTTANLNGDSNPDLVVASFGANSVSTFFGNSNGTFVLSQNIAAGAGPVALKLADFGTDGILDLAVANYNADTFTACTGNAGGVFSSCSINNPVGGTNPISITAGDFTGNGTRAMATALSGTNAVNVFGSNVAVGVFPNAVETADFNGDSKPDMITANSGSNDVSVLINSCLAAKGNLYDYNGDRKSDYSVFRPANTSYFVQSLNPTGAFRALGRSTDMLVPADFDGDRRTDLGYYRPDSGLWVVHDNTGTGAAKSIFFIQFGLPEDIPAPADFDGDGKADLAVFRPSNGTWYVRRSNDNSLQTVQFGAAGDKPVAVDFDGDSIADFGIFRPSTGVWYIWRSSDGQFTIRQFGISEDKTVAADYDGDGKSDIAVWRPSTAVWYILRSSDDDFRAVAWGLPTDLPLIGDYEGDGKFDYAVWRPSDGTWYVQKSSDSGTIGFQWGVATDKPIPNTFVR